MKKVLSTVAALGLVAGMASAAQALEFTVSGNYFVEGVYQSSGDGEGVSLVDNAAGDENSNDAFWRHEFIIRPVMEVNEKIAVKSKIYLANTGVDTAGNDGTWGTIDTNSANGNTVDIHQLYMEYTSPIGMVRIGRASTGFWQGDFLNSDTNEDVIMYFPNFLPQNFGACVYLQKDVENDSTVVNNSADGDADSYEITGWYKTQDLIASLAYDFVTDKSDPTVASTMHVVKGYYNQNFGAMYAESEFAYALGDQDYDAAPDQDIEAFAMMADVGMTMDKLDVGMLALYVSGDSDGTADTDLNAALNGYGLGEQFQPYVILTGATTGMLTGDYHMANADMTDAGVISVGMHADFAVTDLLNLHSALAWAQAEDTESAQDKDYGWEVDLGVSYSLMDNLTYSVDFGYLATGDFFEYDGAANTLDTNDIYVLTHRLTMEF